jgi:flagellar L-ring protein precursor FlgH
MVPSVVPALRRPCSWSLVAALVAMTASSAVAGDQLPKVPPSDHYEALYARYLESARVTREASTRPATASWMVNLALDPKARQLNDLVTIRVIESINAAGTADSSLDKNSKAKAGVSQLFGAESQFPSWLDGANLVGAAADTQFKGAGSTTRSGQLTAMVTARVVEVLANGDLVLEGAREIQINGDRQVIVLTGVVRTADIDRSNVVSSAKIGQLRISYFGRGLIRDNLQPGWLIRVLNKIF